MVRVDGLERTFEEKGSSNLYLAVLLVAKSISSVFIFQDLDYVFELFGPDFEGIGLGAVLQD